MHEIHSSLPSIRAAFVRSAVATVAVVAFSAREGRAQDRLKTMPGYEQHHGIARKMNGAVRGGSLRVKWAEDSKAFEFAQSDRRWRFDLASGALKEVDEPSGPSGDDTAVGRPGRPVERGRQSDAATSPDGKLEAFYKDRNLWLRQADGTHERAITTEGDEQRRIKCGSASWVYGEELDQNTAMWWSPDSLRLAFYRFDESPTRDYYLQLAQTKVHGELDVEAYPKAGDPNPIADIRVFDVASSTTVAIDVRDGKPFGDDVVGHYAYNVRWAPSGHELLFHRTNRRQNVMELCAADPASGKVRVVIREEWLPSWVENNPEMRFLADGRRFVWTSERSGFANYFLYDLAGKQLATLTAHDFDVQRIVRLDEDKGRMFYMARSGDNPMKSQLHRVQLDGSGEVRLTDPTLHHAVDLAPDGEHFIDVAQTHALPPCTRLVDARGQVVRELAQSDTSKMETLGLEPGELFTFPAADGKTTLHGLLFRPSNFDPAKRYPLLLTTYSGPGSNGASENFATPRSQAEYGFLIATLDTRAASGKGKRAMDAIYRSLGVTEIDDLAAGIQALGTRPYVDASRVGVYGTSYGGYAAVMCLLRHPKVFRAAAASSAVTDWRHYDTIYTERYMDTPQANPDGYAAGSALTYANDLVGRLMLYYGTADNNVHPNNTMQLIAALQRAGKSFDVQVGPDEGHSTLSNERMMEFFIENLVMVD